MKKHRLLYTLLVFAVAMCGLLVLSCGDGDKKANKRPEGPETGIYYYESDGVEYLITLNGGDSVTVLTEEQGKTGTYSVSGNTLSFKFGNEKLSATLAEDILTLDYNGTPVRFTKKITYTVKFDSNGGSSVASVPVVNGKTIVAPSDPVRDDFEFIGWYKDSDKFDSPFIFGSDIVTENITLYARWVKPVFGQSEFTVSFDLGYETDQVIDSQKTVGGKLYDLVTPTREGYVFRDWWVSMYDDSEKLSYKVTADTVFNENTTVYALWQSVDNSGRLAAPIVDVSSSGISWGSNANAQTYHVEVTYIEESGVNATEKFDNINTDTGSTSVNINFAGAPAGDYIIAVNAVSGSGASSDATVRYYRNKALARVSLFTVVEPSTLVYNGVDGAEKYLLSIDCGDSNHKHTSYDNGLSTSFNFANCLMKEGGIKFTVTAVATGRASSTSAVYTYNDRVLDAVSGIRYDSTTEEVSWNGVANALGYVVDLSCEHDEHDHNVQIEVGNKTSISLKTFDPCNGKITVSVKPVTKGYISPKATEIEIEKTTLAAPTGITIKNDVLSWDSVASATSYEISIGGTNYTSNTNSFNLTEGAVNTTWTQAADYQIRIMAKSGNNESLWSDAVDARYYAMYSTITYNGGEVSWRHVIGVDKYNVRVNDGEAIVLDNGVNRTAVRLTQAGENTIYVNFVDDEGATSDWYSVTVFAHTIDFDLRGGSVAESDSVASQYYAIGDKLYLPTDIEKTGYDFAGWYTTPLGGDGLGALYNDSYFNNAGGFVLYAYWTPKVYTVTFDGNGGTVDVESKGVTYLSDDYAWPVAVSTDSSLIFAGWFSDKNGLEIQYTDEKGKALRPWTITRDMTVYACWNSIFSFEKLSNGTYRVKKNTALFGLAPSNLTIPATYQGVDDARPINVTEIGSSSFTNSSMLITVNIPNSIRYVDTAAFNGSNNITAFTVYDVEGVRAPEYSAHDGVLYHSTLNDFGAVTEMEMVIFPRAKTGEYAMPSGVTLMPINILNSAKITKLTIPATVTVIERHAIYSCSSLTEIEFEYAGNVTEDGKVAALNIYDEAIASCSKLTTVKFPARLNGFKPTIFASCSAFATIEIEKSSNDYSSVSGFLCDANKTTILYCPPAAISDSLTLPVGITTIGESAFAGNTRIKEVIFPLWSSEIKTAGFSGCTNLERIVFNGVAVNNFVIGERAFERCTKLKYIVFDEGSKVTEFGKYAFTGCTALESIDLPETLVKIDEYAFERCTRLDNLVFPSKLGIIGQYAFTGCTKLANISFAENGVDVTLDDFAFNGCSSILSIDIPANVAKIGDGVFAGCTKLATIEVDPANEQYETWDGVLFSKGFTEILFYPLGKTGNFTLPTQVKRISDSLFKNITTMQSITISSNVIYIGREAFMGCTGLTAVYFDQGDGETLEIGASAFRGCTELVEAQLPDRVKVIPNELFYNDQKLSITRIPKYVTEIGDDAFYYCYAIESVTLPATLSKIGYRAFYYCSNLSTVLFEDPPIGDNDDTVKYATELNFVMTSSNSYAFYYCTSLTSINIPKRMTSIPNSYLYGCSSLEYIAIPNTISSIGARAFYSCSSLHTVDFADGNLTNTLTFGDSEVSASTTSGVFSYCSKLQNINIPARIKNIPAYTFYNCRELLTIVLPNSLSNVGSVHAISENVFYNCTSLETVTFANGNSNPVTIDNNAFRGCAALKTLNLPKNLKYTDEENKDYYTVFNGTNVFNGCVALETVNVEVNDDIDGNYYSVDGILYYTETTESGTINELVFCPSARTKNVTIPYYVTAISVHAFNSCRGIESIVFENTPSDKEEVSLTIKGEANNSNGAFVNNTGLNSIALPDRLISIGAYAFSGCTNITSVELSAESRLKTIDDYAFFECYGLSGIVIPKTVTTIGNYAFARCTLLNNVSFGDNSYLNSIGDSAFTETIFTSIVIPNSVTVLGDGVFKGGMLKSIVLPTSLSSLGSTFEGCDNLDVITLDNDNCANFYVEDSVIYDKAKTTLYFYPIGKTEASFDIISGVTTITKFAFSGNDNLQTVNIPNSVIVIGEGAFNSCGNLRTVNFISDDSTSALTSLQIGASDNETGVFEACDELVNINLPSRLTVLGCRAFYGCEKLNGINMFDSVIGLTTVNSNTFANAGSGSLLLPDSVIKISSDTFSNSTFSSVGFYRVEEIEANAFKGSAINSITLPSTVKTIGASAFAECNNLTDVTINLNNTADLAITTSTSTTASTGRVTGTFYNCVNLKNATIATNGILPYWMFAYCNKLEVLTVTGNATISGYLCYELQGLKTVNIAKTVKTIGNYAFYKCVNLGSHVADTCVDDDCKGAQDHGFNFTGTMTSALTNIGNYVFYETAISSFVIPSSVDSFGTYTFTNNKVLSSVSIPVDKFTSIPTQAFNGCSALSSITFTGNAVNRRLTTVSGSAFKDCINLTSFDFTGFTSIGGNSFENSGLTSVTLPDTLVTFNATAFKNTKAKTVSIPTKAFTTVANYAFADCGELDTVTFRDSGSHATNVLTTIGNYAFSNCVKLKTIVLPNTVTTINQNAFNGSGLENITLGAGVSSIDNSAFVNVSNLSVIHVETGNTSYKMSSDNKALLTYDGKTLVKYISDDDEYTIPTGVEVIEVNAFKNSSVSKVIFNDGLVEIKNYAFMNCANLDNVTVPSSLTSIGTSAFEGCTSLKNLVFNATEGSGLQTIGTLAFRGCENLLNFTLPGTLTTIGVGAFSNCTSITVLTIPSSVTIIQTGAFAGCTALTTVTVEEGDILRIVNGTSLTYTETGDARGAFADCTSLKSIDLSPRKNLYMSATLSTNPYNGLGNYTFAGCSDLTSFVLPETAMIIGVAAFMNCVSIERITIPANIVVIERASFAGCVLLERVTIEATSDSTDCLRIVSGSGLTDANRGAFADCVSLKTFDFSTRTNLYNVSTLSSTGDSNKALGNYTFSGCTQLESVVLPGNIITIGQAAFMNAGLKTVTIPSNVRVIQKAAFAGNASLTSVTIAPDTINNELRIIAGTGLVDANRGAFADCEMLTSIDLSTRAALYNNATLTNKTDTYKTLAAYTFSGCTNLENIVFPSNIKKIDTAAFMNDGFKSITIPSHVVAIGKAVFAGNKLLQSVYIEPNSSISDIHIVAGTGLVDAARGTFADCEMLESVDFTTRNNLYNNDGITSTTTASYKALGAYTFNGCTSLKELLVPSNILTIGDYSLHNCTALSSFDFHVGLTTIGNYSFQNSGLVNVVLPHTITTIRNYSFEGCLNLESIIFENNSDNTASMGWIGGGYSGDGQYMTSDRGYTFSNTPKLKTLVLPNSVDLKIGDGTFVNTGLEEVYIPGDTYMLGQYSFSYNPLLRKVTMSSETSSIIRGFAHNPLLEEFVIEGTDTALRRIGSRAFEGCTGLKHFNIPDHFEYIDQYGFMNSGLVSITIPDNFLLYGSIFLGCKDLSEVIFKGSVNNLGPHVFEDCISLESIAIPYNRTGLTTYMFQGCTNLREVILHDALMSISDYSFVGCTSLKSLTLPKSVDYIGKYAFYQSGIEEIIITGSNLTVDSYAFAESALKRFVMADGVDEDENIVEGTIGINDHAFYNCKALTSVTLPSNVVGLNDFAFAGCTALTQIIIPQNTVSMGEYVFDGWGANQTIYVVGLSEAPEGWSEYWNWNSKQVDVTPEPSEPEEGEDPVIPDPVYETRPDKPCDAVIVWSYVAP